MKRTPLKRKTPLKAKARMKSVATPPDAEWSEAREAALRRDLFCCQARRRGIPEPCFGHTHVHHIKRRSQGGSHQLENLVTLCLWHHHWVHANVAAARELGLLS